MGRILSRIITCSICEKQELTHRAYLPDEWATLWDYPYTMCDECILRWKSRFSGLPVFYLIGGEKEITLFEEI